MINKILFKISIYQMVA